MEVGDLVRYHYDGDIGIITEVNGSMCDPYYVQWADDKDCTTERGCPVS